MSVFTYMSHGYFGRRARGLLAAGALATAAGACSAALDFTECASDEDCAAYYEDDKPMRCEASQCVVRASGCGANSQCAGLGEAYICTNSATARVCASTESELCSAPIYPGDGSPSDDVVFIGVMMPKEGPDAELGAALEKAALQAVKDFNAASELQNGSKIAVVTCDTKGDRDQAILAGTHLGETLTIPVFVGPLDDVEFTAVVEKATLANRVNAFTTGPMVSADLSEIDTLDLVWLTMPGAKYQGRALGSRIERDFAEVPNANAILLLAQNSYGTSMYEALATQPTGSGPNRVPEIPGGQYISSYQTVDDAKARLDAALGGSFGDPSMLIVLGRSEVAEVLQHYKASGKPWPQRVYVPHRAMAAVAALGDPDLAGVVTAIAPVLETPGLEQLRTRAKDTSLPPEAALAYDATMLSLLGMAAVRENDPVVGPKIATAMARLADKDGDPVDFASAPGTFIPAATGALKGGTNLDVAGLSGPLDFDGEGAVCGDMIAYRLDDSGAAWVAQGTWAAMCPDATGGWDM